jgi:hypothetical protein
MARLARRIYLSVEAGARLLVDDAAGAQRLAAFLDLAYDRFGLQVEAMLLQDPAWTLDPDGAAARVARVLAFNDRRHAAGRPVFAGLHLDIEPHTLEAWQCGGAAERRAMVRQLQAVFRRVAQTRVAGGAPAPILTAALPWWLGPLSAEVPEAAPPAWLSDLDEAVLMVYGHPGGPLVGESAPAVLARVDDARLWTGLPAGRGLRIGLATFEYRDEAALGAALDEVSARLGARPGFRGLAVFAEGEAFGAVPVPLVEGQVLDEQGTPVAGARVTAGGLESRTNRCGLFGLKGTGLAGADIDVRIEGFLARRLWAPPLVPGRLRQLPPIRLRPAP